MQLFDVEWLQTFCRRDGVVAAFVGCLGAGNFGTREGWRAAALGVGDQVLFGSLLSSFGSLLNKPLIKRVCLPIGQSHIRGHVFTHVWTPPPKPCLPMLCRVHLTLLTMTTTIGLAAQALRARDCYVSLGPETRNGAFSHSPCKRTPPKPPSCPCAASHRCQLHPSDAESPDFRPAYDSPEPPPCER